MNFGVMRGLSFHNVMNSERLSSSEIHPSMEVVLGAVKGEGHEMQSFYV